ncbi:MAG: molybdopterin molybdotransferase [Gaiellaceae bacterium]|jgi:molybdopterin molybdotransferase|nr:molybdopterin molybdotransferase [Gaiellaceae bacterium]
MPPLLSIEEALARVLARARPLEPEPVPLAEAAGRVLAQDVASLIDLPPFPSSAMDGFAIRAADVPGELPIVFRIAAGLPAERPLEAGEAMEISTGGTVPEGADAVVPIENVVAIDNRVHVPEAVATGAHIRPIGGDVRAGDALLAAGTVLGAAQVGALAAAGIAEVSCARRPRVVVLSTGTELRPPGEPLDPGQIYESNGPMLVAAFEAAGARVDRIGPVADDEEEHRRALEWGLEADVLVSSGGVSVGPHDLVRRILAELGAEEDFWGVAVRPGKPIAFATRGSTLVFGLPGNPVSALVAVELFVRPVLRALQGDPSPGPVYETARLAASVRRNATRDELVRARRARDGDEFVLDPVTGQESHMIARAAGADALVLVPAGEGELAAGEAARYLRLS